MEVRSCPSYALKNQDFNSGRVKFHIIAYKVFSNLLSTPQHSTQAYVQFSLVYALCSFIFFQVGFLLASNTLGMLHP